METSYQHTTAPPTSYTTNQPTSNSKSVNKGGYLLIAIGIITLIGSLVATGCLYSQLSYTSFAIGGAGIVCCILSILLGRFYGKKEEIIDILIKSAQREEDAYLIDFSKVNPGNISKIFKMGPLFDGVYGDVSLSDKISFDEKDKFKYNFPYQYSLSIVVREKNEFGFNSFSSYNFTMNEEGKVESYGKLFDNFDAYLESWMKRPSGSFKFEHFDFQSVQTDTGPKKLRKKASH